jgi:methylmalonyl-CoA/ethylmalonyl-CoA epimerase
MGVDASSLGIQDLILGLQHVGYITEDTAASIAEFRKIYDLRDDQIRIDPPLDEPADCRFTFVDLAGAQFELIEPISGPFKAMLGGERPGINHVAWKVSDIDGAVARMAERGIRPGHVTPGGVMQTGSSRMIYFNPADTGGMLVELLEFPE